MHQYGKQVSPERMLSTLRLIDRELGTGEKMLYRYTGVEKEENTFVACAFWMAAALAVFGETEEAENRMNALLQTHEGENSAGIMVKCTMLSKKMLRQHAAGSESSFSY